MKTKENELRGHRLEKLRARLSREALAKEANEVRGGSFDSQTRAIAEFIGLVVILIVSAIVILAGIVNFLSLNW